MPETVRIDRELGLIEVVAVGHVSGEDIAGSLQKIAELGAETGLRNVLVDVTRQIGEPDLAEMFELMRRLPAQSRFALFSASGKGLMMTHRFGEMVASNRGLALELFESRSSAVAWLTQREPIDPLRLPRKVEAAPGAAQLVQQLAAHARPLWPGAELSVPHAELSAALEAALKSAFSAGRIVRGLESAERVLAGEDHGLKRVDRTTGVARGGRISRLLVLADDGSERFYREVESLLLRHAPRVLALRLPADERALGQLLFGPDQRARLLMVEHKDAVSAVLLALASCWSAVSPPR